MAARQPEIIEEHRSQRGVRVVLERHYCPNSGSVPYIAIRYGDGRKPGRASYFFDNKHCWPYIEEIRDWFLEDRDNLGHAIEEIGFAKRRKKLA